MASFTKYWCNITSSELHCERLSLEVHFSAFIDLKLNNFNFENMFFRIYKKSRIIPNFLLNIAVEIEFIKLKEKKNESLIKCVS